MTAARRVWAGLQLLDRQLVDRDGRMAGCVDDLELTAGDEEGRLYVTAILSGPGAWTQRLGGWRRRVHAAVSPDGLDEDPTRIPFNVVSGIGNHVSLGAGLETVGSALTERWVRDHVVAHIPGSGHAPE
jgi:hypothetical protein